MAGEGLGTHLIIPRSRPYFLSAQQQGSASRAYRFARASWAMNVIVLLVLVCVWWLWLWCWWSGMGGCVR
jgi:hypothetical protein